MRPLALTRSELQHIDNAPIATHLPKRVLVVMWQTTPFRLGLDQDLVIRLFHDGDDRFLIWCMLWWPADRANLRVFGDKMFYGDAGERLACRLPIEKF